MYTELRFHIEALAEDLLRSGVMQEEAVLQARIEFAGVSKVWLTPYSLLPHPIETSMGKKHG
jgi:hypothetical protein